MATGCYVGVNGVRKIKSLHVGVVGTVKKVKAIYMGVNGAVKKVWSYGSLKEVYLYDSLANTNKLYTTTDYKTFTPVLSFEGDSKTYQDLYYKNGYLFKLEAAVVGASQSQRQYSLKRKKIGATSWEASVLLSGTRSNYYGGITYNPDDKEFFFTMMYGYMFNDDTESRVDFLCGSTDGLTVPSLISGASANKYQNQRWSFRPGSKAESVMTMRFSYYNPSSWATSGNVQGSFNNGANWSWISYYTPNGLKYPVIARDGLRAFKGRHVFMGTTIDSNLGEYLFYSDSLSNLNYNPCTIPSGYYASKGIFLETIGNYLYFVAAGSQNQIWAARSADGISFTVLGTYSIDSITSGYYLGYDGEEYYFAIRDVYTNQNRYVFLTTRDFTSFTPIADWNIKGQNIFSGVSDLK